MAAFVEFFNGFVNVGRPAVDLTGVTGRFDFVIHYATRGRSPLLEPSAEIPGPTLFQAPESVGLSLQPRRAPIEVLVVDAVNKTPVGN